ncbi:TerD family protein [Nocardia sp. NBC_01327]|uniref:TerD family protein n=1 Tax=Nocardia sp. NBC_01327 TaxID=2903593 RepID=UPI002E114091|nr:TerD family protein [Nocardia sp. NBC_01327]
MSIALQNIDGTTLESVAVALGWDPAEFGVVEQPDGMPVEVFRFDLNLAALLFSGDRLVDVVFHDQLISQDGSVRHTGDNQTGEGPGDNEVIVFDLVRMAPEVTMVIVVVTSYTGQSFANIDNAYCRFVDAGSTVEINRFVLTGGTHTALVLGRLYRTPVSWEFDAIGAGIPALHVAEVVPHLTPYLS